jgi:glycosyltransferase involved in cell wall biosynthesis
MFSLIVSTRNRVQELERLLASLEAQTCKSFEVIVVDQNEDGRLDNLLLRHDNLRIRHLRSGPGLSHGRNAGLRAVTGDVVAFPDDDCWYAPNLLAGVQQWLDAHPEYDGVLTGFYSPQGKLMTPQFAPGEGPCNKGNILRCVVGWSMFLRAYTVNKVGCFRENMGVGSPSPYQSGEDLDYPLRALERGFHLWFAPGFKVYHPDLRGPARPLRVAYGYALGVGRVWRMHGYSWIFALRQIVLRTLGRAVLDLLTAGPRKSFETLVRAIGESRGYWGRDERLTVPERSAVSSSRDV